MTGNPTPAAPEQNEQPSIPSQADRLQHLESSLRLLWAAASLAVVLILAVLGAIIAVPSKLPPGLRTLCASIISNLAPPPANVETTTVRETPPLAGITDVIKTRKIILFDNHRPRYMVRVGPDHEIFESFHDAKGQVRLLHGIRSGGEPTHLFADERSQKRISLSLESFGSSFYMEDTNKVKQVSLDSYAGGTAKLEFRSIHDAVRLSLGLLDDAGSAGHTIRDRSGEVKIQLSVTPEGQSVYVP